ncbi:hypothetical protein F441_10727 [Phytophthora nicotianae CJ01A1]|uniref:Uncharacterized protein n=5 Tax=Phytophthora nicotianae TaxID=4792 RepID=V9F176_PHYNI|nr:hypothetical protein F443_10800 [Phytophthora nicotianae P1569]ETK84474.1 hypothetical protein L915_10544 [Phytophthora nicotianae]ETO59078.1 hypothetical protein F444_22537 [Phytophthora nicotianae P1976]ETP14315.1 hypothetical protein F441_10727 [Phytophthora nicotianae CJ01A1]ETP42383.1 hypothetical protein F442_10700 [Phytophthora nicotianae P10297]
MAMIKSAICSSPNAAALQKQSNTLVREELVKAHLS